MPDHDLWMAFFRDPDRNLLALMCEVRSLTSIAAVNDLVASVLGNQSVSTPLESL